METEQELKKGPVLVRESTRFEVQPRVDGRSHGLFINSRDPILILCHVQTTNIVHFCLKVSLGIDYHKLLS